MAAVQGRSALRVTYAYRTVSEEVVEMIASMIPNDLLLRERKQIYNRNATVGSPGRLDVHRTVMAYGPRN